MLADSEVMPDVNGEASFPASGRMSVSRSKMASVDSSQYRVLSLGGTIERHSRRVRKGCRDGVSAMNGLMKSEWKQRNWDNLHER
jgi:hypothetical protein